MEAAALVVEIVEAAAAVMVVVVMVVVAVVVCFCKTEIYISATQVHVSQSSNKVIE